MGKAFISKIIIFTVFILLFSSIGDSLSAVADNSSSQSDFEKNFFEGESSLEPLSFEELDQLNEEDLQELGVTIDSDFEDFNEDILSEDFDVEEAVYDLDLSKMEGEEKEKFLEIIKEAAAVSGTSEPELLEDALMNIFDSESDTFNDLEATQEVLEENYEEKIESEELAFVAFSKNLLFESDKVHAATKPKTKGTIRVGIYLAGAVFNAAIGGVVGGGVSAIKSYIKKKGTKAASETLSRVATEQAKKLKIYSVRGIAIATIIGSAVTVALNYADFGLAVAKFIDSKDWYKNNGWIDITK